MAGNFFASCLYLANASVAIVSLKVKVACSMISVGVLLILHCLYSYITEAVAILA